MFGLVWVLLVLPLSVRPVLTQITSPLQVPCVGRSANLTEEECTSWHKVLSSLHGRAWGAKPKLQSDPCSTTIMDCSASGAYIVGLSVFPYYASNGVPIPSEVGLLTALTSLEMINVCSSIPSQLSLLTALTQLVLSSNGLEPRAIPPSLIAPLTNISFITLSSVPVSILPSQLGLLKKLTSLKFSHLAHIRSLPDTITHLPVLKSLDLIKNIRLVNIPQGLYRMSSLDTLRIQLAMASIPSQLGQLTNLLNLEFRDSGASHVPETLSNLSNLKRFSLGGNSFHDLPDIFANMNRLKFLSLDSCGLTHIPAAHSIFRLPSLRYLTLERNQIQTIPNTISQLSSLTHLVVSNNQLLTLPTQLEGCVNMVRLEAANNDLHTFPRQVMAFRNISYLILDGNTHLSSIPSQIGTVTKLDSMSLEFTTIRSLPSEIGQLTALSSLSLRDTALTSLPSEIGRLTLLESLALARNALNELPTEFGLLKALNWLDLQRNSLERFPVQLAGLTQLTSLMLEGNGMCGNVPPLDALTKLNFITMHENRLTGDLPATATHLVLATFHSNQFRGSVPQSLIHSMFEHKLSSSRIFTLGGNFLSCKLPVATELDPSFVSSIKSFIAPGNVFQRASTGVDWLSDKEKDAKFLFVDSPVHQLSILWILLVGLASLCVALLCAFKHSTNTSPLLHRAAGVYHMWPLGHVTQLGTAITYQLRFVNATMPIVLVSCVCLLPIYLVYGTLYECGRLLGRITVSYFIGPVAAQWILAVLFLGFVCQVCAVLRGTFGTHSRPPSPSVPTPVADSANTGHFWYAHKTSLALRAVVWAISLFFLNSPVFCYIILRSLPDNNTFELHGDAIQAFAVCFPVLITVISGLVLPMLCRWVVAPISTPDGRTSTYELALLWVSRSLIVLILPIAMTIAFDDGCFQYWRVLWSSCSSGSSEFDFSNMFFSGSNRYVLTTSEVCSTAYRSGRCSRRVLEVASDILLQKLVIQSTFQPALYIIVAIGMKRHLHSPSFAPFRSFVSRFLDFGALASVQGLTWVELAMVVGPFSPVVSLLALMAICTNLVVGWWAIREKWVGEREHDPLPVALLWLSLAKFCVLVCWFFADNALSGYYLLIVAVPLAYVSGLILFVRDRKKQMSGRGTFQQSLLSETTTSFSGLDVLPRADSTLGSSSPFM